MQKKKKGLDDVNNKQAKSLKLDKKLMVTSYPKLK